MFRTLSSSLLFVALPTLLCACPLVIGMYDDSAADDDDDWGTVIIESVIPSQGGVEGGETVQIRGQDLDAGGLWVWFGDQPAAVLSQSSTVLEVVTPRANGPGSVDVMVENEAGRAERELGFVYEWSGEGLDGGRVFLFYVQEPSSGGTLTEALARLYEPDDWGFLDHLPTNGSCQYNVEPPNDLYDYLDAGSTVSLRSAQHTIPMSQTTDETGGPIYEENNVPLASIEFNATYSLDIPGGDGLPEMTIEQAVRSGSDMVVFDPDISAPQMAVWQRNPGATLQWTQGGIDDSRMLIQVVSIDQNLNPTGGNITCTSNDSGGMVFGPTELAYLEDGYNALYVSRYDISEWTNEFNGSDGHGVFVVSKIGVIWLQ